MSENWSFSAWRGWLAACTIWCKFDLVVQRGSPVGRNRLLLITLAGVGVAAVACTLTGRALWPARHAQPAPPETERPALTIDPRHLNFGEVWETDRFEWTVPVQNEADLPLRVAPLNNSCGCVGLFASEVIPPNGTTPIKFVIDLRERCASVEPKATRDVSIQVSLGGDAASRVKEIGVELRGRVKSALLVPAKLIDFGLLPPTANLPTRVVPIRALRELSDIAVAVDRGSVSAELKPVVPGQWELFVRPTAPLVVGRHEAKVTLAPTTQAGEKVPPVVVPVAFDVLHDIQPDTSTVVLGAARVGETVSGTFTISSQSGYQFVPPTCAGAILVNELGVPRASHTFRVERTVEGTGNGSEIVTVRGRAGDGTLVDVRIELKWYGLNQ